MATVTQTISACPTSYDTTNYSYASVSSTHPLTYGETDSDSTTYAEVNLTTGSGAETYVYYKFDFSEIPSGATIQSVSAKAKGYVSNTNANRINTRQMQLCRGTTLMGSALTLSNSATEQTFSSVGTWTRDYLLTAGIRYYVKRGTSSTSSAYTLRMYGATMTVTYQYNATSYTITVNAPVGVTTTISDNEPIAGDTVIVTAEADSGNLTWTDNGVDVTSSVVKTQSATDVLIPNGNTISGFTSSNISNAYTDADSDTSATLTLSGGTTGTLYLDMSDITIPSGASILSVSCRATLQYGRNGSSSGFTASCQMYAGSTAKGSSTSVVSSGGSDVSKTTFNLTVGSWIASEINSARFYLTATNNASRTSRYMYVYGVSFSVTYESDGYFYTYTITNVSGNHSIVISAGASTQTIYFKDNGSWVAATKVYKKISGSWVEQTNLSAVFEPGTNYVRGN